MPRKIKEDPARSGQVQPSTENRGQYKNIGSFHRRNNLGRLDCKLAYLMPEWVEINNYIV